MGFQPEPSQGVMHQEAHDPAHGVELIDGRHVVWLWVTAKAAAYFTPLLVIEILISPTQRLKLPPEVFRQFRKLLPHLSVSGQAGQEQRIGIVIPEKERDVPSHFGEGPPQGLVGQSLGVGCQGGVFVGEVPFPLGAAPVFGTGDDGLGDEPVGLGDPQGEQAVQEGEGRVLEIAPTGLSIIFGILSPQRIVQPFSYPPPVGREAPGGQSSVGHQAVKPQQIVELPL